MSSSTNNRGSPVRTLSNNYDSDESDAAPFDAMARMSPETLEKSLTNINIHIAAIANRREEQMSMMKEFFEKFMKEQQVMAEETRQCLPTKILTKYGGNVPSRVYVELPSRALWRGSYCKMHNCIEGLEGLFSYYDVKPYHLFVLFYGGGHKFNLEIFNVYGVEIFYSLESKNLELDDGMPVQAVWLNDCYYFNTDFKIDKLHAQFNYNCYKSSSEGYELVIGKQHLQPKIYNQVLCKKGCQVLGLADYTKSVEIGFNKLMFKIELHWINGSVFFNKCWCDFIKEGNVCEGDICVLQKTSVDNRFEVALFEKHNVGKMNRLGVKQGKSVMKFIKVLSRSSTQLSELELPRLFVQEYGILLLENVHLLLPDGKEFCVQYDESVGKIRGLQKLINTYLFKDEYVLMFDYVGRSHFLLSVYNERGEDAFGYLGRKVLLGDVMQETDCPINHKDDLQIEDGILLAANKWGHKADAQVGGMKKLIMEIKSNNFNGTGNGLYIGQGWLDIFGKWTTGTKVTLLNGSISCLVEVDRRVDIICFEKGWIEFLLANQLKPGQRLEMAYRGKYIFDVTVHE